MPAISGNNDSHNTLKRASASESCMIYTQSFSKGVGRIGAGVGRIGTGGAF